MFCGREGNRRSGGKKWQPTACWLTACTPGSDPGPTLGNEYGKPLGTFLQLMRGLITCLHTYPLSFRRRVVVVVWSEYWAVVDRKRCNRFPAQIVASHCQHRVLPTARRITTTVIYFIHKKYAMTRKLSKWTRATRLAEYVQWPLNKTLPTYWRARQVLPQKPKIGRRLGQRAINRTGRSLA